MSDLPELPPPPVEQDRTVRAARASNAQKAPSEPVLAALDQLRVSAINEDWHTFDQVIGELRAMYARPPVQPTEPK